MHPFLQLHSRKEVSIEQTIENTKATKRTLYIRKQTKTIPRTRLIIKEKAVNY